MNTREYASGNYYQDEKGNIEKLDTFEINYGVLEYPNDLKPIPLTEEVLLRCGAVRGKKVIVNENEYYKIFWINEFFNVLFIYNNYGGYYDFEIVYQSHGEKVYGIKNTEYLHTLQNFLSLTGEELTYNHS